MALNRRRRFRSSGSAAVAPRSVSIGCANDPATSLASLIGNQSGEMSGRRACRRYGAGPALNSCAVSDRVEPIRETIPGIGMSRNILSGSGEIPVVLGSSLSIKDTLPRGLSAVPFYVPIVHYAAAKLESAKTASDKYEWLESGYNLSQI